MALEQSCAGCRNSRKSGGSGVYCLLFGIMIREDYNGCKDYRRDENEPADNYRKSCERS